MLQDILGLQVFAFSLVFLRVGTAFILLPGFNATYISPQARIMAALAVSFVVTPPLTPLLPALPPSFPALALLWIGEVLIGAFIGTIARAMVSALQTAGTVISYVASMANAFINDPVAEQQSSVFAGLLGTMGVLLIFVTDMHHLMLRAVVESYALFEPGAVLPVGDMANLLAHQVGESFKLGVQLSMPLVLTGLTYYIGLGLLGRLMPQLQVFFFGMPVQIMTQLAVLMIVLSSMMLAFLRHFEDGMMVFLTR